MTKTKMKEIHMKRSSNSIISDFHGLKVKMKKLTKNGFFVSFQETPVDNFQKKKKLSSSLHEKIKFSADQLKTKILIIQIKCVNSIKKINK